MIIDFLHPDPTYENRKDCEEVHALFAQRAEELIARIGSSWSRLTPEKAVELLRAEVDQMNAACDRILFGEEES